MLDLKNWFNPKHYKRLWNVGPPGLIVSLLLIYLTLQYEESLNIKKYETGHVWIDILFLLILLEMLFILFWTLFSLPPKKRGKKLFTRGIYSFIRHPEYTVVIFHINILTSLWVGSYLLLFLVPLQYLLWSKIVVNEEEYLVGIFGQEYIDYMSNVSRFIPWK